MSTYAAANFQKNFGSIAESIAISERILRGLTIALLLLFFAFPVAAQTDTITANGETETISIRLNPKLGADTVAVTKILQQYPYVKITDQAEYEITPYPDFPMDLLLIDREDWDDQSLGTAYRPSIFGVARTDILPIGVGRLDDDSFSVEIERELRKVLRAKQLFSLKDGPNLTKTRTMLELQDADCPQDWDNYILFCVSIHNDDTQPVFAHVLRIDDKSNLTTMLPQNGKQGAPIPPGGTVRYIQRDSGYVPEIKYHYVTITSRFRIDGGALTNGSSEKLLPASDWTIAVTETPVSNGVQAGGGGIVAPAFAAPWQVQLYSTESTTPGSLQANDAVRKVKWEQYEKVHRCGGTLIARDIVLTAAHCVAKTPFSGSEEKEQSVLKYRRVKVGTQNLETGGTTYAIDSVVVHKSYKPGNVYNDIALIRIKADGFTHAEIMKRVEPILLPGDIKGLRPLKGRKKVSWYGWGLTRESTSNNTRLTQIDGEDVAQRNPAELRVGQMAILDHKKCEERSGYSKVTKFMLCAVTRKRHRKKILGNHSFTCLGDSGGPIVREVRGKPVQVGVISWAVGCGANDNPSVSANLFRYYTWVKAAQKQFVSGKRVSFQEND